MQEIIDAIEHMKRKLEKTTTLEEMQEVSVSLIRLHNALLNEVKREIQKQKGELQ